MTLLVACGPSAKRPALAPPDPTTPALPVLFDVMVPKRSAPGGDVLGQTTCATSMVIRERRGASTRVTLSGESFWVDDVDLEAAPRAYHRCIGPIVLRDARVSDELAHALTPRVLVEADAWSSFDPELPKSVYQRDDADTSCVEFQFGPGKLAAPSIEWGFTREGARDLRLTGPTIKNVREGNNPFDLVPAPGEEVGYLCLRELFVARRTKDAWELVHKINYDTEKMDIWAYSPASAQRWYATRPACEKGLARGRSVAKIPFAGCM